MAVILVMAAEPPVLQAQNRSEASVRTAGTVTNVYHTLDPASPIDAFRVELPASWDLKQVHLLRYGTEPVPVRVQRTREDGVHRFAVTRPISGPHELVLRVQFPPSEGTYTWRLTSLIRTGAEPDSSGTAAFRDVAGWTNRVSLQPTPAPDQTNRALDLTDARAPVILGSTNAGSFGRKGAFTIEFWMRTNGLDEVVLSAWNGDESVSYPAEFVVDRAGRLRFYSGRPGNHRALRTNAPISDGKWHHVALVYDHSVSELRLFVDGSVADSSSGYVTPASKGPLPIALGGRLPGQDGNSQFSGRLDEVRVWSSARADSDVRQAKTRSLPKGAVDREQGLVAHAGFETSKIPGINQWPEGARRVPSSLAFRPGVRNFRADTDGSSVTLRWAVDASDVERFVIERSTEGTRFARIAVVRPAEVKRATVSEIPEFTFTDNEVSASVVFYRIRLERSDGAGRTSGTIKIGLGADSEEQTAVDLVGNFPNPFSKSTTIAFEVNRPQPVAITVWDLAGHRLATLLDDQTGPGYHEVSFEAADLPSGTYFLRLETPTGTQSHRMVVLK